ncbi:MAG: hypothetical protein QXT34_00030 [Candidatus Aenigmatarchaeota archaeon]
MVYDISLTLILVVLALSLIFIFLCIKKRRKSLEKIINEIENDLIDIKRNLERIKVILNTKKEREKTINRIEKRRHARKRSV